MSDVQKIGEPGWQLQRPVGRAGGQGAETGRNEGWAGFTPHLLGVQPGTYGNRNIFCLAPEAVKSNVKVSAGLALSWGLECAPGLSQLLVAPWPPLPF